MLHYWVEKNLGKPKKCEQCKSTDKSRYHWSNISGNYHKDLSDWERLCVPCHLKKDFFKTHCLNGHELSGINLYIRPNGHRECRACKVISKQKWTNKMKLTTPNTGGDG